MASLNQVQLIGNVGRDPEIRATQSGQKVATLSLATTETWTDKRSGERKESTEWSKVVVWHDGLVGVIERFVRKGSKLYVCGKLQTRKWQDKDGTDRYTTEVVLNGFGSQIILLDSRREGGDDPARGGGASQRPAAAPSGFDDDIPF